MSVVDTDNETLSSLKSLEVLIEHCWDMNSRDPRLSGTALLWFVARDTDLVKWCLDHGADLDPADDMPPVAVRPRKPIFECSALNGNLEAFETLRAAGPPVSYDHGLLPSAVMLASNHAHRSGDKSDTYFKHPMAVVRHLMDVVGCDVDSISYGSYYGSGSICSTPL